MTRVLLRISEEEAPHVFSSVPRPLFEAAFDLQIFSSLNDEPPRDLSAPVFRLASDADNTWSLAALSHPEWKPLVIRYTSGAAADRLKRAWQTKELLKDALAFKKGDSLSVVDATAGLLGDATLLATWGHKVVAFEQNPALCFLGHEALSALRLSGQELDIELHCLPFSDASSETIVRKRFGDRVDRVYLDPLYPARPKDALNSKELRMVAELGQGQTQPTLDRMIEAALNLAPSRVVVKRPQWEKILSHPKLQVTSCLGRSTRFDIIHTAQRVN